MNDPYYTHHIIRTENKDWRLSQCSVCGALIMQADTYKHTSWHQENSKVVELQGVAINYLDRNNET